MTLTEEYAAYPSDLATSRLQDRKIPWTIYGCARNCKAVLYDERWSPAPVYAADGTIDHGVDCLLYPMIVGGEVVNIVAFHKKKMYLRVDTNIWELSDLMEMMA